MCVKPRRSYTSLKLSISAQLRLLEEAFGQKLFRRGGRSLVLNEMGQVVLSYADEIFSTGPELLTVVKQQPGSRPLRLNAAMTDALSDHLRHPEAPFHFRQPVHVSCRQALKKV